MVSRLFNQIDRKSHQQTDLIQASKGVYDTLSKKLDSKIKGLESESAALVGVIVHKEMESKLASLEQEYSAKFLDLKDSVDVRLKELVSLLIKDQMDRLEKSYDVMVGMIQDFYEKSFDNAVNSIIDTVKSLSVQNTVNLPEMQVKNYLPEMNPSFNPTIDVKNVKVENIVPLERMTVNVEAKAFLQESDKTTEKSIVYDDITGRPSIIREKTLLIPKE